MLLPCRRLLTHTLLIAACFIASLTRLHTLLFTMPCRLLLDIATLRFERRRLMLPDAAATMLSLIDAGDAAACHAR